MEDNSRILKILFIIYLTIVESAKMSFHKNEHVTTNPKIIIIGAGSAGIAAASKLMENGFTNVTILEAENRIGGRVHTTEFGNYSIDLGGQWVHGSVGNVIFDLVHPLGLLDNLTKPNNKFKNVYIESNGEYLPSKIADEILDFSTEYLDDYDPDNNTMKHKSIGQFAEKQFIDEFSYDPEVMKDKKKYLDFLELSTITVESAESWNELPLEGNDDYYEVPGDQMINWKTKGYSMILDVLMKRYPNPKKELPVLKNTILNTEVSSIDITKRDGQTPVLIKTSNGQTYEADHVIVTVSLGVLKDKHQSLFIPSLPSDKIKAIKGLNYGTVTKIYLQFEKPFWHLGKKRCLHYSLLWNDNDRKAVEANPEKVWVLGINSLMTVEHKPNLLVIFVAGKYAKLVENLPEEKVFKHTVEILHQFLGKKLNVTKPLAILRSKWFSNPHFRGTYTYRSFETEEKHITSEMLEEPISADNPLILFAGEATSKDRFGTVDGAVSSGWNVVDRILRHYKKIIRS